MALLTPEEKTTLWNTRKLAVSHKCDNCGKPITSCLTYYGAGSAAKKPKEYCSRVCHDAGERGAGSYSNLKPEEETIMAIDKDKKKKKAVAAEEEAETPKKKKAKASAEEEETPKKKKKAKAAEEEEAPAKKSKKAKDEEEEEAPAKKKKAKASEEEEEAPAKKKKAKAADDEEAPKKKAKKSKEPKGPKPLYRPDSAFGKVYERLQSGKTYEMDALFKGIEFADPKRLIAHMAAKGKEKGLFTLKLKDGTVKLIQKAD